MIIPILTTDAGRCLTVANWQEVGVQLVCYQLTSLLMKPGLDFLIELSDFSAYTGWPGAFVLNASMPKIDDAGGYTLRSSYDGSRCRYTMNTLFKLISRLNPPFVVLPQGANQQNPSAWLSLPSGVFPFFSPMDMPSRAATRPYGIHLHYDGITAFSSLLKQISEYDEYICYVSGELNAPQLQTLAQMGMPYLESDMPSRDACQGTVYHHNKIYSLQDEAQAFQLDPIDPVCHCPTCSQKLTRAYLHHLLEHTPLLCQRFLIQHNIYYSQTSFTPG
ncbi:MAG TPA: queuine tRNA-ribosyltransferase [Legionella sp.]|nr:queuine tRNA-ribosyltransferase [Legionella sp.]